MHKTHTSCSFSRTANVFRWENSLSFHRRRAIAKYDSSLVDKLVLLDAQFVILSEEFIKYENYKSNIKKNFDQTFCFFKRSKVCLTASSINMFVSEILFPHKHHQKLFVESCFQIGNWEEGKSFARGASTSIEE